MKSNDLLKKPDRRTLIVRMDLDLFILVKKFAGSKKVSVNAAIQHLAAKGLENAKAKPNHRK